VARTREAALREQCKNNLRIVGNAIRSYHDQSAADKALQSLPPARLADGYATWAVLLAPYLTKERPLISWDQERAYVAQNDETRDAVLRAFICPARRRDSLLSQAGDVDKAGTFFAGALGDYACVAGDGDKDHDWTSGRANGAIILAAVTERKGDRIVKWESRTGLSSLTRGESYTLLVGEKHAVAEHFGDAAFGDGSLYNGGVPANFSRVAGPGFPLADAIDAPVNNNFGSWHKGICQFLLADGTVHPYAYDISTDVLARLARRGE
jgi:hypothetical protein